MSFSAEELIKVLKACKSARVTELKVGDIEVKLHGIENPGSGKMTDSSVTIPTDSELEDAHSEAELHKDASDADEQLAFMQIEEPAEYERLLVERELEDGRKVQNAIV